MRRSSLNSTAQHPKDWRCASAAVTAVVFPADATAVDLGDVPRSFRQRRNSLEPGLEQGRPPPSKPRVPSYHARSLSLSGSPHVYPYSICTADKPASESRCSAALTSALPTPVPCASTSTETSPQWPHPRGHHGVCNVLEQQPTTVLPRQAMWSTRLQWQPSPMARRWLTSEEDSLWCPYASFTMVASCKQKSPLSRALVPIVTLTGRSDSVHVEGTCGVDGKLASFPKQSSSTEAMSATMLRVRGLFPSVSTRGRKSSSGGSDVGRGQLHEFWPAVSYSAPPVPPVSAVPVTIPVSGGCPRAVVRSSKTGHVASFAHPVPASLPLHPQTR